MKAPNAFDLPTLADNLCRRRAAAKLTRLGLALRSGVSHQTIGNVERAERRPTLDTIAALARALGCGTGDLLRAPRRQAREA